MKFYGMSSTEAQIEYYGEKQNYRDPMDIVVIK